MARAIAITRREMTAAALREATSARAARRTLAIALVLEGVDRKTAAEPLGIVAVHLNAIVQCQN